MSFNIGNRINSLRKFMQEDGLDAVLVSKDENVRYFSDFTGDSTVLLITGTDGYLITDGRYIEQAQQQIPQDIFDVREHKKGLIAKAAELIKYDEVTNVAVEGSVMTVDDYFKLQEKLHNEGSEIKIIMTELDSQRIIKDEDELSYIRKAVEIADKGFEHILDYIRPGVSEKEVARELEYYMACLGSERPAFTTIVASGKRGALPHGVASDKLINSGEFVTIDFGAVYGGYHSDITRTIAVGRVDSSLIEIYNTVLKAQLLGLEAIAPGVKGQDVDKAVRDCIAKAGYGKYFIHGLGHGVGLEIHELPRLSPTWSGELLPNMVVTDEPGIYIPDHGGVRIEDTVLVTSKGCQPLTQSEKKLIIL